MKYSEDDIASNVMDLLSASSLWIMVRHQWLIGKMRSILTGEHAPALDSLYQFDEALLGNIALPDNLMTDFISKKSVLESVWLETTKINHPLSGLSLFEQLNVYQQQAHHFLFVAKEFNQHLWHEFTMRDALTGAWSRLTLKTSLMQELHRIGRQQSPSTIALLGQDKFKEINDQWGHNAGDAVLAETAKIIQHNLRPSDKLFRYGGDEWLILMPNTNSKLAQTIIARIQTIMINHQFDAVGKQPIQSSFSFGLAQCTQFNNTQDWIAAADKDLYSGKTVSTN
jgi:diguanylate cyclase (GGDEF)-like protein